MPHSAHADWKQILRTNFTKLDNLCDFLELPEPLRKEVFSPPRFVLNLPVRLAQKAKKATLDDPIARQFIPLRKELEEVEGFVTDPVGDQSSRCGPKLLHKYKGRVLLVCTSACAMHCRYCFRQNFDYEVKEKIFEKELAYIKASPDVHEVILSGGDPLSLPAPALNLLCRTIGAVPHVKKIRFHSRFPIGIPERIDEEFLSIIDNLPQQVWFVIHTNHAAELDDTIFYYLKQLQKRGAVLLNQSVLLKGVNDNLEALCGLSRSLIDHGILPYYLHQLDRVKGASHFEVTEEKGLELIDKMAEALPGYAVPKYVKEIAGEPSKSPVLSTAI